MELFPYERCIFYTVVTSIIALDRVALKEKVVDAPEVLAVIDAIPNLATYLNSLYFVNYKDFFKVDLRLIVVFVLQYRFLHTVSRLCMPGVLAGGHLVC